jgi:hypothetical protein
MASMALLNPLYDSAISDISAVNHSFPVNNYSEWLRTPISALVGPYQFGTEVEYL